MAEDLRPPPPPPVLLRGALLPDSASTDEHREAAPVDSGLYEVGSPRVDSVGRVLRMDIRHAGTDSLQLLPGIGPVLAGRIADWRKDREGGFRFEDLLEVKGIGPALLTRIRPHVVLPDSARTDRPDG